ncbi:rhodoquinone biosynthesis methyltransferase RquA [Rhodoplanes roseus]|uniref:Methyltransferase n=1 Tax=Rhodoplanes roseus TaxID=29409 RepID=A0A327L2H6_9BRAD|nr:rhodoquinone biosynthesis methyltransferase RquA [Rhodoplanes roseus]RAI44195.1 methyltransferase [Rhodoplanes roseus]
MESAVATPTVTGGARSGLPRLVSPAAAREIPPYLDVHYWWAYVHPNAVRVFERQWLANLILWGNYARLRDAALDLMGERLPGRTLQVACAYGDLTPHLCSRVSAADGTLDIVDVLPVQLDNVRRKLPADAPARLVETDSSALPLDDASYDRVLLFFLLHEQPESWRRQTLAEAVRVLKPGGRVVIVDYARPVWWNPLRYVFAPVLAALEPFALDLWRNDITRWIPNLPDDRKIERRSYFGGLYQAIVISG